MRESCSRIIRYVRGLSFEAFRSDEKTVDAVLRNLAVIGEAVKHLPHDLKDRYPQMDWRKIAGLRDIIVHEYFGIDEDILWDVVKNKIPKLLESVEQILSELTSHEG
ncbi:DUF86 domain-containing protein [Spirochaeta thermophila]|uniref:HepT-like ribonuclease domain-containing protein n=1 Tax=Winmispira thermophila TaxID=154 RepID=UPI00059FE153|nr:DUF86 domain-containing protein [Spirochaeta thermophila]